MKHKTIADRKPIDRNRHNRLWRLAVAGKLLSRFEAAHGRFVMVAVRKKHRKFLFAFHKMSKQLYLISTTTWSHGHCVPSEDTPCQ